MLKKTVKALSIAALASAASLGAMVEAGASTDGPTNYAMGCKGCEGCKGCKGCKGCNPCAAEGCNPCAAEDCGGCNPCGGIA